MSVEICRSQCVRVAFLPILFSYSPQFVTDLEFLCLKEFLCLLLFSGSCCYLDLDSMLAVDLFANFEP